MKNAHLSRGYMGLGERVPSSRPQAPIPALVEAKWQFLGRWGKDGNSPRLLGKRLQDHIGQSAFSQHHPRGVSPHPCSLPTPVPRRNGPGISPWRGTFPEFTSPSLSMGQKPFSGGKLRWGESDSLGLEPASLLGWMRKMRQVSPGLLPTYRPPDSLPTTGQTGQGLLLPPLSPHSPSPGKRRP